MMKTLSCVAGLALTAWLASPAAADDDKLAIAIDAAITPLNAAEDGYATWFTGDIDADERRDTLPILVETADTCSKALKDAFAAGAKPSTEVTLYHRTIALGAAETEICDKLRVAAKQAIDAEKAAEEARIAPYKKALKGDRLTLWMKYQEGFHGPGCREISTPAQLAKAKSWYIVLEDDSGVVYRWTTRQYSFKGDKLVVSGKERTGTGRNPPSKACP